MTEKNRHEMHAKFGRPVKLEGNRLITCVHTGSKVILDIHYTNCILQQSENFD